MNRYLIQTYASSSKVQNITLSKLLDMTAPRLSEILNEKKEPTYRQAQKIATTLNIDADVASNSPLFYFRKKT